MAFDAGIRYPQTCSVLCFLTSHLPLLILGGRSLQGGWQRCQYLGFLHTYSRSASSFFKDLMEYSCETHTAFLLSCALAFDLFIYLFCFFQAKLLMEVMETQQSINIIVMRLPMETVDPLAGFFLYLFLTILFFLANYFMLICRKMSNLQQTQVLMLIDFLYHGLGYCLVIVHF